MSKRTGLLTKLLGPNGTHKGYDLRLVGHSLGGSICALTGLMVRTKDTNSIIFFEKVKVMEGTLYMYFPLSMIRF